MNSSESGDTALLESGLNMIRSVYFPEILENQMTRVTSTIKFWTFPERQRPPEFSA